MATATIEKIKKVKRPRIASTAALLDFLEITKADIHARAADMGVEDVRYMVDSYYDVQASRKAAANREGAIERAAIAASKNIETVHVAQWVVDVLQKVEEAIKKHLDAWTKADELSRETRKQKGIDTIIAAGLRAHVDFNIAVNVSKVWRFGGYDPTLKWLGKDGARQLVDEVLPKRSRVDIETVSRVALKAGRKPENVLSLVRRSGDLNRKNLISALARRPWNADLKLLFYKIGDSFVKRSNDPMCPYGTYYKVEKAKLVRKNEAGEFSELANSRVESVGKSTKARKAFETGRLPDDQIDKRARRLAVKLFIAHWWSLGYELHHKKPAPEPWCVAHAGHTGLIRREDYWIT